MRGYRRLPALEPDPWFRSVTPTRYLDLYRDLNGLDGATTAAPIELPPPPWFSTTTVPRNGLIFTLV